MSKKIKIDGRIVICLKSAICLKLKNIDIYTLIDDEKTNIDVQRLEAQK